jgi:hypothetical protein
MSDALSILLTSITALVILGLVTIYWRRSGWPMPERTPELFLGIWAASIVVACLTLLLPGRLADIAMPVAGPWRRC